VAGYDLVLYSCFAVLPVLHKDGVMDAAVRPTAVNPTMQGVIALLALAANVICLAVIIKRAKEQKKTVLFTRLPTLTVKIRFLPSATVM